MSNYDFDNPWQEKQEDRPDHIEGIYAGHYAPVNEDDEDKERKSKVPDWMVITLLGVLVVVVTAFSVNAVLKGTSIFEVSVPVEGQVQAESTTIQTTAATIQTAVSTTAPTTVTTTVPATVQTTAAPVVDNGTLSATTIAQSAAATSAAPTTAFVPSEPTKEEILKAVGDAINSVKDPAASFKVKKSQVINLKLTDCSLPMMVEPVNKILEIFAGEKLQELDFTNGKAINPDTGEEITSNNAMPPTDKPFTLTVDGVAEATHQKDGENDVYIIKVVPESSTLSNPRPPYHNSACDTFDMTKVELPMGEVTKADFEYPGATVSVTINPEGKVVHYQERLEIKGTGEAKLGVTGSGTIDGSIEEKWDIEWK